MKLHFGSKYVKNRDKAKMKLKNSIKKRQLLQADVSVKC